MYIQSYTSPTPVSDIVKLQNNDTFKKQRAFYVPAWLLTSREFWSQLDGCVAFIGDHFSAIVVSFTKWAISDLFCIKNELNLTVARTVACCRRQQ